MRTVKTLNQPNRTIHFDLIRFIATYVVVQLHVATPWLWREPDVTNHVWIIALFFDVLGRIGVPIFLMISGALLLRKQESYQVFFSKRLTRVFLPLLFWTIVYEIKIAIDFVNAGGSFSFDAIYPVLKNPFEGPVYEHLWFLYMITGMYLVTPFLRKVVRILNKQDRMYLFWLWTFADVVLPLVYRYTDFRLGISFPIVTAYLGFYVMGYYLSRMQFTKKQIKKSFIVFISVYIFNVFLVWFDSYRSGKIEPFFLAHHTPGIYIQAISAFIFLNYYCRNKLLYASQKTLQTCKFLGMLTFGIYLLHPLIIEYLEGGLFGFYLWGITFGPPIGIPLTAIVATIISGAVIALMQKIPGLKLFV